MPLDITVVFIFSTLFLSLIASLVYAFWYQNLKHKSKTSSDAASSMRVSELEALIGKAVADATRILEDRLAALEVEVEAIHDDLKEEGSRSLPPRSTEQLLSGSSREPEVEPVRIRRRDS